MNTCNCIELYCIKFIKSVLLMPERATNMHGPCSVIVSMRWHSRVFEIMDYVYKLLKSNRTCTFRELYYALPRAFKNQQQLAKSLKDVCELLQCNRNDLNICMSQRGLQDTFSYNIGHVAGCLLLETNKERLDIATRSFGIPISLEMSELEMQIYGNYLVIVEKYTVYMQLCNDRIWEKLPMVLITGCGFPSHSTRKLVDTLVSMGDHKLSYLGDLDPHGMLILLTYMKSHCNTASNILWIGIHVEDIERYNPKMLPIYSSRDVAILNTISLDPYIIAYPQVQVSVKYLIQHKLKVEIESISEVMSPKTITQYVIENVISQIWSQL
ncbi:bifunctional Winged helix-like DNA-binding domain superfamily/Topoisomerase 6 subunit A-Spo11 [Babesia duncani]|uniref:DNA topoisomerase (ATP-hydrolyzing) n=1 Tax=Babesia duncani TaxID=323732 RepID=A0AAD9UPV5_9APIC|nr:bifunctional Winged helix-like DNA-binding domain superfamily/Topoisomerase 6 subunit A-Spo11 [Babesia duncani]